MNMEPKNHPMFQRKKTKRPKPPIFGLQNVGFSVVEKLLVAEFVVQAPSREVRNLPNPVAPQKRERWKAAFLAKGETHLYGHNIDRPPISSSGNSASSSRVAWTPRIHSIVESGA